MTCRSIRYPLPVAYLSCRSTKSALNRRRTKKQCQSTNTSTADILCRLNQTAVPVGGHCSPYLESIGRGCRGAGGTLALGAVAILIGTCANGGAYLASARTQAGGYPARNASFRWSSCSAASCAAASAIGDWMGFCCLLEMCAIMGRERDSDNGGGFAKDGPTET